MRLFIAADPDEDARGAIDEQVTLVRRQAADWDECVRWAEPGAVHLTLRFLGETPRDRTVDLLAALGSTLPLAPFAVELGAAGTFRKRGGVRTIWLSIGAGRDALLALHAEVTRRLRDGGWSDEARPFAPHLTIGRVGDRFTRRTAGLEAAVLESPVRHVSWRVDRVILYESDLSGPRPRYVPRHQTTLSGPARRPD